MLVPRLTLASAINLRLKNENCNIYRKKKKSNNPPKKKTQRENVDVLTQKVFTKIEKSRVLTTF